MYRPLGPVTTASIWTSVVVTLNTGDSGGGCCGNKTNPESSRATTGFMMSPYAYHAADGVSIHEGSATSNCSKIHY